MVGTGQAETPAERRMCGLLRVFSFLFLGASFLYLAMPLIGASKDLGRQLPFVSNSVVKVGLLMLLCMYAAGDLRRRAGLVWILIGAHIVSVAAMLLFIVRLDMERTVSFFAWSMPIGDVLWGAIALDGVILAVLLAFWLPARKAIGAGSPVEDYVPKTGAERFARALFHVLGVAFLAAVAAYALAPMLDATSKMAFELPYVSNSCVKVFILAMLALRAARQPIKNAASADMLFVGHAISLGAMVVLLFFADIETPVEIAGQAVPIGNVLWGAIGLDGAIVVLVVVSTVAAWRARFNLGYLRPIEFRALVGASDVLIAGAPGDEALGPTQIATNVDRYLRNMRARRRIYFRFVLFGFQLHPLLRLRAPMAELSYRQRDAYIRKHFRYEVFRKRSSTFERIGVEVLIRVVKQLANMGYYSDPSTHKTVGYVKYSERPLEPGQEPPKKSTVDVKTIPHEEVGDRIDVDVCVIGSGAGGAIAAYGLAKRGRSVLILERGPLVQPSSFTEDEIDMVGKLYSDGALQTSEDFRFTVVQGDCVGGSTTVNNAVSLDPPPHVLAQWNDRLHADLDLDALGKSVKLVKKCIGVVPQTEPNEVVGRFLNPSGRKYEAGLKALPGHGLNPAEEVEANIKNCLGCGYCNMGCAYGAKLSMLETVLPQGQEEFGDRFRILAECEVERIRTVTGKPRHKAKDVVARLPSGRRIHIKAKTVVLGAGAVASSYLLLRSGIGRELPVGKHLCFNMGAPMTAEFPPENGKRLSAHEGLQISHLGIPAVHPEEGLRYVLELWWNPPVAQSIYMPGWFENHFENMKRYADMMAVGCLVGTERNGEVRIGIQGDASVRFKPRPADLKKLADGLHLAGRLCFAAKAKRVMPTTWGDEVFTKPEDLDALHELVLEPGYFAIGSGHPQGGNAICRKKSGGVVDPSFRVHGYDNLYIADASVFPSAVGVNPQITVMALAHYAAGRIE